MSHAAAEKQGFIKDLPRYAVGALLLMGWFYLRNGHGRLDFAVLPGSGWATVAAAACLVIGVVAVFTSFFERLPWQGAIRTPIVGGYGWSESVLSRLGVALVVAGALWLCTGFFGMAVQAWYQTDWGRLAVSLLFLIVPGVIVLMLLPIHFRPVLVVDGEGVHTYDDVVAWGDIEKIGVGSGRWSRDVYLYLNTGPALGPARRVSLGELGVPIEEFLARVEELAPQVVIERPAPAVRLFA
jgi:hypothetical protein